MKWVIYWTYYISSLYGEHNISGVIKVMEDSVYCYVLPYQYCAFKIDYIKITAKDNELSTCYILASRPYCILTISIGRDIRQSIRVDKDNVHYADHVIMKRKRK